MVLIEYDIIDGAIRETHRFVVVDVDSATLGEVMEHIDNSPCIDRESVRIFSVRVWDDEM